MIEIERVILRNPPLCDGTPRHAKGYRPYVTTLGPDSARHFGGAGLQAKRVWIGPILPTEREAKAWLPSQEAWAQAQLGPEGQGAAA